MTRYARLYLNFLRFSFSRAFEFRLDFFFRIVMDCIFYAVQIAFFGVLYRHTAALGGWTFDQILVFVGGFFVVDALHMTLFANNMWWFPFLVNKGDLDYHLVRPVSALFFVSVREFRRQLVSSTSSSPSASSPGRWSSTLIPSASAAPWSSSPASSTAPSSTTSSTSPSSSPVFWLHSNRGLAETFYATAKFSERPDRIYQGLLRRVLVSILPYSLVVSVPARLLFDGLTPTLLLNVSGVTVLAFLAMRWFWNRGLASYSSASS